jgi:hypothetical protein
VTCHKFQVKRFRMLTDACDIAPVERNYVTRGLNPGQMVRRDFVYPHPLYSTGQPPYAIQGWGRFMEIASDVHTQGMSIRMQHIVIPVQTGIHAVFCKYGMDPRLRENDGFNNVGTDVSSVLKNARMTIICRYRRHACTKTCILSCTALECYATVFRTGTRHFIIRIGQAQDLSLRISYPAQHWNAMLLYLGQAQGMSLCNS